MSDDPYAIEITRKAEKSLSALPPEEQARIAEAIDALADDPRPRGCKCLKVSKKMRIRVGNYRVIYDVRDGDHSLTVLLVSHRRDAYR